MPDTAVAKPRRVCGAATHAFPPMQRPSENDGIALFSEPTQLVQRSRLRVS
ncbi:hypothetical protein [Kingella potus]|uniref:hypothetical protein n=1 Tax=Kingella potus TaxID=265175 RepID=UPI001FD61444|nr:hypothetical protein [Kingella potus]UOP00286.1 hypothetical protein LVJ84_10285 [Kingella potus]